MKLILHTVLIIGLAVGCAPALCAAQSVDVETHSWSEVFEYGYENMEVLGREERIGIDSSPSVFHDQVYGRCELGAPDSVVLISRSLGSDSLDSNGWRRLPSFMHSSSSKQRVNAPSRPDTLQVRITRTICFIDNKPHSFVLEHAGRYVHMDVLDAIATSRGMIWLFAAGADGRLSELRWSPVLKRIETVAQARKRWTAASWRRQSINWVLEGSMWIGMTPDMVREVLGAPDTINHTITANMDWEQWVYRQRGCYVYVRNGRVSAIQQCT